MKGAGAGHVTSTRSTYRLRSCGGAFRSLSKATRISLLPEVAVKLNVYGCQVVLVTKTVPIVTPPTLTIMRGHTFCATEPRAKTVIREAPAEKACCVEM